MRDPIATGLLARYLSDECDLDEVAFVDRWMAERDENRAMVMSLRRTWDHPRVRQIPAFDADDALWHRIVSDMAKPARPRLVAHRTVRFANAENGVGRRVWWAAAMLLVVASGLVWRQSRTPSFRSISTTAAFHEVATRRGERTTLRLADGTRVILAPESRLRIQAAYAVGTGPGVRELVLEGEAYFAVRHDTARPFRVRTAHGIAEDLGTEFVVTAYPETHGMQVLVASGEVMVHRANFGMRDETPGRSLAVLGPDDFVHVDTTGTVDIRQRVDARHYATWTAGQLVFVRTPLRDVLARLQRWYEVDFRLSDPALADRPVTVAFDRKSVRDVVETFELMLHVRAERQGNVVTFVDESRPPMTRGTNTTPQGGTRIP